MFWRSTHRRKDSQDYRSFRIAENQRLWGGKTVPRTVLYGGESNGQPQAAWRRTLDVFDEDQPRYTTMSLFPDDWEVPADARDSVPVKLSGLQLRRPRIFDTCWLAWERWQPLGRNEFGQRRLPEARAAVSGEKVVGNRRLDPGSEFGVHCPWFVDSARDELWEADLAGAGKDRRYRCLDRVWEHPEEWFV